MDTGPRTTLERLEREGWDSLCAGTGGDFYGRLMTPDGLMILAHGVAMTREEATDSLRDAPPWASYELDRLRLLRLVEADEAATLVYHATARREGGPDFVAWMSSTYVRLDGQWRLALYTQTPVPG